MSYRMWDVAAWGLVCGPVLTLPFSWLHDMFQDTGVSLLLRPSSSFGPRTKRQGYVRYIWTFLEHPGDSSTNITT